MSAYLRSEHVSSLLEQHRLRAFRDEQALVFYRAAESYPWRGAGIDWTELTPNFSQPLDVGTSWFHEVEESVPFLVLIYSEDEAIGGRTTVMLEHLDELVWCAPGRRVCVGATAANETLRPLANAIFEYDGGDSLRLHCPALSM